MAERVKLSELPTVSKGQCWQSRWRDPRLVVRTLAPIDAGGRVASMWHCVVVRGRGGSRSASMCLATATLQLSWERVDCPRSA